jgi:hypothetical protein
MITYSALGYVGKLGNQMFQYATLVGIAHKNGYEIKIPYKNANWANTGSYNTRLYLLDMFDITAKDSSDEPTKYYVTDESSEFKPKVLDIPDDCNLFGYFQTEKYFKHCKDAVRKEFTFKNKELYSKLKEILNSISSNPKVAIHIRRGDYVGMQQIHSLCSPEYYDRGLDYIKNKLNLNIDVVVFSDDISWCKSNLNALASKYTLIYDQETESEVNYHQHQEQSLMLMTLCDHFVIANSSFSWWGSWMSCNENKITVAPSKWYGNKNFEEYKDIYCDEWVLL